MNSLSKKEKIILILVVLFGMIILLTFLYFSFTEKENPQTNYTEAEKNIPVVSYQPPIPDPQIQQGSLVITSNPDQVRVIIDAPEEEVSAGPAQTVQTTPFRIDQIGAGKHQIFASKEGYEFQEIEVEILPNQINRVIISLLPTVDNFAAQKEEWINKLPLNETNYSVVYDKEEDVVKVTLIVPDNPNVQLYQNNVLELEDAVRQRLVEIGINETIQKVEWKLE